MAGLKRGYEGVYHHMSAKHLGRYVGEFEGRHNSRPLDTAEQMAAMARGAEGKRLTYDALIGPKHTRLAGGHHRGGGRLSTWYQKGDGTARSGGGAIRPAPPDSGPAGAVEASRTRRTGATRPKPGGYGLRWYPLLVGVRGWKGLYGPLTGGGARPAPGALGVASGGTGDPRPSWGRLEAPLAPGPAVGSFEAIRSSPSSTSSASFAASKLPSGGFRWTAPMPR